MIRIAEVIARKEKTRALVTGESLGQVASQTLENLTVIEEAATMPLLRPLIGMDKQEIIDQARGIGTFDLSAVPDQDCCQLFVPAHPATKAALRDVKAAEAPLDLDALTQLGATGAEVAEFTFPPNLEES
jgi:thiamine biosynthesis protein ThiI